MAKRGFIAAAILMAVLAAFTAPAMAAGSAFGGEKDATDVVVLLDVSQSVLPYFQDVTDYVVSSVVRDFLRYGDTFHLLTFGDQVQVEVAQRMEDERDVKSVLGRLYLLYPLARHTDIVGALGYLYQYLADLPESRQKVVVIITDGVHNPPPGSPTYGLPPEKVAAEIDALAGKIRANGWPVHIIKLPFPVAGSGSSGATAATGAQVSASEAKGGAPYIDTLSKALGAEVAEFTAAGKVDLAKRSLSLPSVEFPGPLGKRDYAFSFPLKITNSSNTAVGLELDRVRLDQDDVLAKKSFLNLPPGKSGTMDVSVLLPDSVAPGAKSLDLELYFANGVRVSPQGGTLALTLARNPLATLFRSGARVALFALLVVLGFALVFVAIFLLRKVPRRAQAPVIAAVRESSQAPAGRARTEAPTVAPRPAAAKPAAAVKPAAALPSERDVEAARAGARIVAESQAEATRSAALLAEAAAAQRSAAAAERLAAQPPTTAGAAAKAPAAAKVPAAKRPGRVEATADRTSVPAYAPKVIRPGTIQVELRVEGQNAHIGQRNVHALHAGSSRSLGGGRSDFLVFLVPVPNRAAELHFDGENLTLVPLRPELFPDFTGPIEDCLGKEIRMLGKRGYPLTLRFVPYERPVDKINRLLHCIEAPGLFPESKA